MKFSLFKEYGALNSKPIFEAFEEKPLAKIFLKIVSCAGSSKSDREAQCHFPLID